MLKRSWIPELYPDLLTNVIQAFSPQVAILIGFIFSDKYSNNETARQVKKPQYILALILSLLYILWFVVIMIQFMSRQIKAVDVISDFQMLKALFAFLVDGVLIYLFATRE